MSWSVGFIGKVSNVVAALKAESDKFTGPSKQEYDASMPSIVALVEQNIRPAAIGEPVVKVEASGHGYVESGELRHNQVRVLVEGFNGSVV